MNVYVLSHRPGFVCLLRLICQHTVDSHAPHMLYVARDQDLIRTGQRPQRSKQPHEQDSYNVCATFMWDNAESDGTVCAVLARSCSKECSHVCVGHCGISGMYSQPRRSPLGFTSRVN